jgi:hypothetical protein
LTEEGDGYFDERVAARYDESSADMFDPAVVDPTVVAGMTLRERWSGWKREPFTSDSRKHVSVWEKPADARQ